MWLGWKFVGLSWIVIPAVGTTTLNLELRRWILRLLVAMFRTVWDVLVLLRQLSIHRNYIRNFELIHRKPQPEVFFQILDSLELETSGNTGNTGWSGNAIWSKCGASAWQCLGCRPWLDSNHGCRSRNVAKNVMFVEKTMSIELPFLLGKWHKNPPTAQTPMGSPSTNLDAFQPLHTCIFLLFLGELKPEVWLKCWRD